MIFGNLHLEKIIQTNDKTRLDGSTSYVSKDEAAVTLVEIEPEAASGFIDVTGTTSEDWFLDWDYSGITRQVVVSIRITTDGAPTTHTETLEVITPVDDKLFSSDKDLRTHEPDILKYVVDGRNSFIDVHRRAQELIIAYLDENGYVDDQGDKLTKAAFIDIEEARQWSTFMSLRLIFSGISNAIDDIFADKAKDYQSSEVKARNRMPLRLDTDGDGDIDRHEGVSIRELDIRRV